MRGGGGAATELEPSRPARISHIARHWSFTLPSPLFLALLLMAPAPVAAPEQFFVGRTEGVGTISVIMSGKHGVRVHSRGRLDAGGALIIDQTVEEEGKPARRRTWRLARAGGNRLTGSITDAQGAVAGEVSGNVFHLRYKLKEGPTVEQWITIQPGARVARNRMVFRKFGMKVASVEETIRRVD
jgi:hypothetical protein